MFIDGFIALVTAFPTASTATEYSAPGYARQAISFNRPMKGIARNSIAFSFGHGIAGAIVGRAIFSSPAGQEMLLAMPFFTPYSYGSQPDGGDAGALCLVFADLVNDATGAAGSLVYSAGTVLGACYNDPRDFIGMTPALTQAGASIPGGPQRAFAMGTMTAGTPLTIKRGVLSAQEMA